MDYVAFAYLAWTCFIYFVAKKTYRKKPLVILSPVVAISVSIIILVLLLGTSYDTYHKYTQGIVFPLMLVAIVFAIPIYEDREVIYCQLPILSIAIMVDMFVGVVSAFLISDVFHLDSEVTNSLMTRSISIPLTVVLTGEVHGLAALMSLFVIITGFVGMVFGDLLLAFTYARFHITNGVVFRNAAHGLSTSRAGQRHETEGVVASLTMILTGLSTVLFGPSVVRLVAWMMS